MLPGRRGMCKGARVTAISLALVSVGDACGFAHREFVGATYSSSHGIRSGLDSICAGRLGKVLPALQSLWRTGNL